MGILDTLGLSTKNSAEDTRRQNINALGSYSTQALSDLGAYGTQARSDIQTGIGQQVGAIGAGTQQAAGTIGQGISAYAPLAQLGSQYGGAVNAYYNALGLGGDLGRQQAVAQFQATPGYEFQQSEAMRQIANNASRFGASGGNTLTALQDRSSQLANQEYNNYLNRLQGFVSPQLQAIQGAATGQAGLYGQLGGLQQQAGLATAGAYGTGAENLVNIGGNLVQGQLGVNQNVATGTMASNNQVLAAEQQDAANKWGAINAGIGAVGNAFKPGLPSFGTQTASTQPRVGPFST